VIVPVPVGAGLKKRRPFTPWCYFSLVEWKFYIWKFYSHWLPLFLTWTNSLRTPYYSLFSIGTFMGRKSGSQISLYVIGMVTTYTLIWCTFFFIV
jgi:hypothetical protein